MTDVAPAPESFVEQILFPADWRGISIPIVDHYDFDFRQSQFNASDAPQKKPIAQKRLNHDGRVGERTAGQLPDRGRRRSAVPLLVNPVHVLRLEFAGRNDVITLAWPLTAEGSIGSVRRGDDDVAIVLNSREAGSMDGVPYHAVFTVIPFVSSN